MAHVHACIRACVRACVCVCPPLVPPADWKAVVVSSSWMSSTWWRVETKTIVCCCLSSSSPRTTSSAPSFSCGRTLKKVIESASEILVSRSRRTSSGSCSLARVKSARREGIVAEKRSVWRVGGTEARMASSCEAKPISKSLSASSKTTYLSEYRQWSLVSKARRSPSPVGFVKDDVPE